MVRLAHLRQNNDIKLDPKMKIAGLGLYGVGASVNARLEAQRYIRSWSDHMVLTEGGREGY